MADSTNPNAGKITSSTFLPRFYRSDANKKFLQATVDQLIQPGTVSKVNGYIGRQNAKATTGKDIFVKAPTQARQDYQLEPSLVVKDQLGNTTFFKDYQDYINQINVFGGNVKNHARLNKQEFYSWDPHIDWDKFVNFQNYYWLPYGPDIIRVYGQEEKVASTYEVVIESQGDNNAYIFSPEGQTGLVRNPVIKLYRGQTYTFDINSPGNPFSIKTARSTGTFDRYISAGVSASGVEVGKITFTVPFSSPDVLFYQSETDVDLGGVFQILSIEESSKIDIDTELLGKKEYILKDGTPLSNGMKVQFGGQVTPAEYATGNYYVEGVGSSIRLVNETILELVSQYTTSENILFDTTPFDTMPFAEATAFANKVDYIVVNRASEDHNPWSRYNRWFHKDVIEASARFNGKVPALDQSARAVRPIIEFEANLKLFNFGTKAVADVDLVDDYTTDVFSTIEGSAGYNVDGIQLAQGQRILFTADTDRLVKNKIYRVEFVDVLHLNEGSRQIHLVEEETPVHNNVVLVKQGVKNQGQMYWYNGNTWKVTQQKTSLNQTPLFDVVDSNGISFSDITAYDGSTFAGTKLFSYKVGTGSVDPNLGFALSYKNINNIGDIVFNFDLETDSFQYTDITNVITQKINVGYLVKTKFDGSVSYVNGWQTSVVDNPQAAVRIYKDSNKVNNFEIDIFDDKEDLEDLVVKLYVNGIRLDKSNWSISETPSYKTVVLNADITTDDVLTIRAFARQPINSNGFYEIPINLQNNPLNSSISNFTLGEVSDHVGSIVDNLQDFSGTYPGVGNLRDLGNTTVYGTKFVQHSGPASLSLYHITSQSNNIVRAIEKSRDDYNKFKRNFVAVAESLGVDTDTVSQVNLILQQINKDKPKTFPYYFSDMVPYGAYVKNDFTVVDYRTKTYPLTEVFSLDTLSNKAVGVYHNGLQLCYGSDYTFDAQGFIVISATIATGDTITIYEYDNTDGCFVPETPTKLGIWPKYEPKIYTDTSLVTPRVMIQGHDGSQTLAYGDYRDDLILELEKRIYNNIKVKYDPSIFDIHDVIPSYNRVTDYSLEEFNEVLAPTFYSWTSLIDRDFTKPLSFDRTNSLTFNYTGQAAPDGRPVPGYWRGIYRWLLDTDRPNICPWEMLGFSEQPSWWESVYGPAPYTSDNLVMWQDIANGLVKEPGKPAVTLKKFAKPFLMEHIPVDESGNIISPLISGLASGVITQTTQADFVFGDVSPVEAAWRRSSHYPFSVILTAMLLSPAKTFGVLLDRSRIVKDLTGQLVYKDTGLRITPSNIVLPSIVSSEARVQTSGIINYLVNYITSDNLDSFTEYSYNLQNLTANLSYRISGFTSKEKFNLLLDSKSPTSSGSVFVPKEDYNIILNSSSPVKKITYSGVIITKLPDGFEVKGYSKTQPYFKYYPWMQSGVTINVGGISEAFSTWTGNQQYAAGKIVEYSNRYYRVKTLHTTTSTFDSQYYQVLPTLPIIGGKDAIFRKTWDRTYAITVPYGTKFKTIQEVVDFLLGYGEWLKDQGFIFDDFNVNIEQVANWETSAKEFLFWTTQNWSTGEDKWEEWQAENTINYGEIVRYNGDYYRAIKTVQPSLIFNEDDFVKLDGLSTVGSSVISLSPAAAKLTFSAPLSVVDDIRNQFNGYELFAVDGKPIPPNFLNSFREDNAVSYTPQGADGIYGASFYLVQKEQVVILNNSTMFNDTIYSPASGYKQDRIKVAGYVSTNWHGAFDVPGFVFDQATVKEWEVWKDYALGDIVRYKEFYYTAKSFLVGTEKFNSSDWYKLDEKPTAQLIPNWTYKAEQFTDFYSLDSDNFDIGQQQMAQHLIGYQKRQYLENIIQDDVSEFKFYQGMIIEKGTQNVFNKLFDVLSADNQESLKFYEEWALRVGQYGASAAYENIEFVLDEAEFKNNPQGFELVNSRDTSKFDFIVRQTPNDVYLKPVGYNSAPWPLLNKNKPFLRSAGYVRPDDVRVVLKTIDDITKEDITVFDNGDYVWCTFEGPSWNVYRYTDTDYKVEDIVKGSGTLTITVDSLVDLPVGSYVGLSQISAGSGFYKITDVTLNTITVAATVSNFPAPFTEQSSVLLYKLVSVRAPSIDSISTILPKQLKVNELVWTDNTGNGTWGAWKYSPVYQQDTLSISSPQSGLAYGRAIAVNVNGSVAAVSTAEGEVVIFDKAGPVSPWLQRQTIVKPFVSSTTPESSQIATILAMSQDGRWLATGSPSATDVTTTQLSNGLKIASVSGTNSGLLAQGVISLYEKDNNNIFTLVGTIVSPSAASNENFGSSIAFGNDSLFVGAIGYGNTAGRVYKLKYATVTKATAAYNPVGSSNTKVVVQNVSGTITAGMAIVGTGFTSGQTVVSVSGTTVTLSAAPDAEPSGTLSFNLTEWNYDNSFVVSGVAASSKFGQTIQVSTDGNTLVIAAPGSTVPANAGQVSIYKLTNGLFAHVQTITGTAENFGYSVAISQQGDYIAVSDIFFDEQKTDQGKVTVYKDSGTQYEIYQVLENKNPENAQFFGSKLAFANNFKTLVVYSANADTVVPMSIDNGTTTFDNEGTAFVTAQPNSGRVDVYDRYANNWVFSESLETSNIDTEGYGTGFAASNNRIFVSAPFALDQGLKSGRVYQYGKLENTYSWSLIHNEIKKPDLSKVKKAFLYNKRSNSLLTYIDVVDANQGKIPGIAEQEIKYKTFYDPATYSLGTSEVNVDEGVAWTKAQVGTLWWDLRTVKFVDSYDNDIVYRNSTWNTLAQGASVDIYEWVETTYLPSAWDALADTEEGIAAGISGQSLYGDTTYSINRRYDNISKTFKNTYYYWVKNKKITPNINGRKTSAQDVSDLIANPRGEGYKYLALTGENSFSLVNVKPLLEDKDVVLSVEYWTIDQTNQNIHSEWKVISNNPNAQIPGTIEKKWFDSLCGKDDAGRVVPDTTLPVKLRYGVESRPCQSMFVNRFEALKQMVEYANVILKKQQIVNQKDISKLETFDAEPSTITGLYDAVIDTEEELRFAAIGSFRRPQLNLVVVNGAITGVEIIDKGNGYLVAPYLTIVGSGVGAKIRTIINSYGQITGATILSKGEGYSDNTVCLIRDYSVLVHSDTESNSWSIYSYAPDTAVWSRTLSQTYDTRNYWKYIDWYETGYNQFSAADYSVGTIAELNTITPAVGELVKIRTTNTGTWLLVEKYSNTESIDWTQQYKVVGSQNGTIQLLPSLYQFDNSTVGYDGSLYDGSIFDNVASVELRNILTALRDNIFIDDLRSEYLNLFFLSVRYALSEQNYLDWVFKTSFVKASHNIGGLDQTVTYRSDNLANFEDYVAEVKPYRTQIREYVSNYNKVDPAELSVTDFDLQPLYENQTVSTLTAYATDAGVEASSSLINSYPWKHWLDNYTYTVTELRLVDSGSGYQSAPEVLFVGGGGSGATARAFISNGRVTRVVLLNPGSGYISAPQVILDGGLSITGTAARAIAVIGHGVVRSSLIKMKFDRITQTYFITQLEETETKTGTGSRLQWPLAWAPDIRIGKSTVIINGVEALRDTYRLVVTKSVAKGYTSYAGSIIFDTAPENGASISVTYIKDWSLLNAADRVQYYYDPATGELGKDLTQLMTGIDYGGVVVSGLGFEVGSGWDSLPYYTEKWDTFDSTFDDYITQVSANYTGVFTLPYVPPKDTIINVYHIEQYLKTIPSDGFTLVHSYEFSVQNPKVYVTTTVNSVGTINTAGSFVLNVASTSNVEVGDVVTTEVNGVFGYNTTVTEIINGTSVRLDQILFAELDAGEAVTFAHDLIEPLDVNLYANGTLILSNIIPVGSNLNIKGTLEAVKIDDNSIVMDGESSVVDITSFGLTVATGDTIILRKSTSDGSVAPQETDYDTALSGGNLAYSTATGLAADDIIVDGDSFVTPTSSSAPEEVVPGQVVDAVAIKVYDKPSSGSANIKIDSYVGDGSTTVFDITQTPNSAQALIVKITRGEEIDGVPTLVSTIKTVDDDYVVDYANQQVIFNVAPLEQELVSIFTFGFNGSNILDLDYFVGNGATTEFVTRAAWVEPVTYVIYVNGVPVSPELFETDNSYDSARRIGIRFSVAPEQGDLITYVIVSGAEQTFAITKTERIAANGGTTYNLIYNIGDALPIESNMIVRVDQEILKGPNNSYFTIKSNRLNYTIDPSKFLPYTVDVNDIVVLAAGQLLRPGTDYILDLSGITVKINKTTYKKYSGKELIISIRQGQGYTYVPPVGDQPAKITFAQSYVSGQVVEVISSYKHDILDIQRTAINVTSNFELTADSVEYYNYTGVSGGKILLDRPVVDDNYVWVVKNGTLLTPNADYKLNPDHISITLEKEPDANDEFTLITYGSNVLTTGIAYMQFKDMLNRVHFKRLSLNKQTRLASDLHYNDVTITVEDASNFDLPNPAQNKPGVVEIRGERIEYFSLNGNVLGQLRRGTLGTGTVSTYRAGTVVQDIGPSETLPYTEHSVVKQIVSDGTNTVALDFVPKLYPIRDPKTNQVRYTPSDIEVFVGGYDTTSVWAPNVLYVVGTIVTIGSYTYRCVVEHTSSVSFRNDSANWQFFIGNIRLKKEAYKVHNVNVAPDSPEGDVELAADFTVTGNTAALTLTNKLTFGTQVTVIKRQGTQWDSTLNIQNDDSKIAKFLKATPGIWYTELKKSSNTSSFDSTAGTFDSTDTTFDQG